MPVVRRLETIGTRELAGLCEVLIDCVEGGASVNFMWPMTRDKADAYWRGVGESLVRGERALVIAEDERGEILGTAQAIWAPQENQPHREVREDQGDGEAVAPDHAKEQVADAFPMCVHGQAGHEA